MIGWIVGIIIIILILIFIYEWISRDKNSMESSGILTKASRMGRGACSKLKEKLFGC